MEGEHLSYSFINFLKTQIFSVLDKSFEECNKNGQRKQERFSRILELLHDEINVWISRKDYLEEDIGLPLSAILAERSTNEDELNGVFQVIFQVFNSLKHFECNDARISEMLLRNIIAAIPKINNRTIISNCSACIHMYVEMFPQSINNLELLWVYIKDRLQENINFEYPYNIEIDILVQLIDDFKNFRSNLHEEKILIGTIENLLKSDEKQNRKFAYYLFKKLFCDLLENMNKISAMWMSPDHLGQIEFSWRSYITILENLEEGQSHLILPSLANIEELIRSNHLATSWLDILYEKMLTHNNKLVLRWSIEFLLKSLLSSQLSAEILKHLLQATNSNLLFNYEGYFLKNEYISSFLKGDEERLLTSISKIANWKSIPLYMWLENLKETQLQQSSLTFEDILKISACVRSLQNCYIRGEAIKICHKLFKPFEQKMCMNKYVTYIETLYNSSDKYLEHSELFTKKSSLLQSELQSSIFKQRFYEIFTNSGWDNTKLLSFLHNVPVEKHGWLKFAPFQQSLSLSDEEILTDLYKINLNTLTTIKTVINEFENTLLGFPPYDKHEQCECREAAISYYILKCKLNDHYYDKDEISFILNNGIRNNQVFVIFTGDILRKSIDLFCFDELLKHDSKEILELAYDYRTDDSKVTAKYANFILRKYNLVPYFLLVEEISVRKQIIFDWLSLLAIQGDKRIEEAFCFSHFKPKEISNFSDPPEYIPYDHKFLLDLLRIHTDITKRKPRYFENSNEHRVKLRIACWIYLSIELKLITEDVLDQIWDILLYENNQLNIVYIYECILGVCEKRKALVFDKIKNVHSLTTSQQVSVISVAYAYTSKYLWKYNKIPGDLRANIVYPLFSLAMGEHFRTRLFAQMCLYRLLNINQNLMKCDSDEPIIKSIERIAGTKLKEYQNDFRLHMHDISLDEYRLIKMISYVTNMPFDELQYLGISWRDLTDITDDTLTLNEIKSLRENYLTKFKATNNADEIWESTITNQIQRKTNPINDVSERHNMLVYPIQEKSAEMFVVASLIDKKPNLGGIARTCEVLGINNLVMDSKMHTEKDEFKNLSMTAERTLNIVEVKPTDLKEFLINKKTEGYKVVGAEQTCNSINFTEFKFPPKCILLLGHEKHGIPAPLLGLLDFAVEIPQFGQVRSLNVHVTGALFMWEFCKQYLLNTPQ